MSKQQEYLQAVTDRLIKQIEENKASWQKPFEAGDYTGSDIPVNNKGKPYNGMNMLNLLAIAEEKGYSDNRWFTFHGAADQDAKVKKGEKASDIYYWKFTDTISVNKKDKEGNDVLDEKGKPQKEKIEIKLDKPKVFFAQVFNAEQIDGLPPREINFKKLEEWERHETAERILNASGVKIINKPSETAYYSPSQDHIVLPERSQFKTPDLYYATALHELGHATGHESRLNRDLSGMFGSESYAKEELRAEIASMLIGQELQIGHDPSQHVAYLESWLKVIRNDPKEVFKAVKDADAIQDYILALDPQRIKEIDKKQDAFEQPEIIKQVDNVKVFINVPFNEKDEVKALGAKWDKDNKSWYINSQDQDKFIKWQQDPVSKEAINLDHIKVELTANSEKVSIESRNDENQDKVYFDDVHVSDLNVHLKVNNDKLLINAYPVFAEDETVKGFELIIEDAERDDDYTAKEAFNKLGLDSTVDFTKTYTTNEIQEIYKSLLEKTAIQELSKEPKADQKAERTYLYVTAQDKDAVKQLGGRYDVEKQVWYTTNKDTSKFNQWLDRPSVPTPQEDFSNFLRDRKVVVEAGHPIMDGKKQRLGNENSDSKNVLYQAYMNYDRGIPSGRMTNFSGDGVPEKWTYPMEYVQKEQMAERVDRVKFGSDYQPEPKAIPEYINVKNTEEKSVDKSIVFDQTAVRVNALFSISPLAELDEAYLDRKGVTGNNVVRVVPNSNALPPDLSKDIAIANDWRQAKAMREDNPDNKMIVQAGSLVIPQFNKQGELRSFETIGFQGAKYALKDGEKDGLSLQLGMIENGKPFLITEGYADGATLHEKAQSQNQIPTVIAFGKGGLTSIALDYRERYPDSKIYIGSDNDHAIEIQDGKEINVGIQNAVEAAKVVNGHALIPNFERTDKGKDWNDIYIDKGVNALKTQLKDCLENQNHSYVTYNDKVALQFGAIENGKPFIVANNYLVAKTLNDQTQQPVVLFFEKSQKLIDSVQELRTAYPDSKIYFTSEKHIDAANAIQAHVLKPDSRDKDWYDVFIEKGSDELKSQIRTQLNAIKVGELGKVDIDFGVLKLEQQKPLRNFIFGLEEKLKNDPIKLHQALTMVQEKIPDVISGKIAISEALNMFKDKKTEEKEISR